MNNSNNKAPPNIEYDFLRNASEQSVKQFSFCIIILRMYRFTQNQLLNKLRILSL